MRTPNISTDEFDIDKSLHNQARFHALDEDRVEAYAEAMKRGDEFPPTIASGRMGKLIISDGNQPEGPTGLVNSASCSLPSRPAGKIQLSACPSLSSVAAPSPPCPWELSELAVVAFLGGHRGATRVAYAGDLRDLLRFAADRDRPLLLLRRGDLDAYLACLLDERGLAVSTVRRRLVVTHQLFAWAVEEGLLARNPAARLRRPRPQAPRPRVRLDAGQVRRLLAAAETESLRSAVLVHLLVLYGCRIGEVLGVDVADIHGPPGARRVWLLAKGGDVRDLPLTDSTSGLIDRLADGVGHGPLLRSTTGRRWHRTNAARHLRRLAQAVLEPAVADRLHPHALRRTFVDLGLAAGATLGELQFALGHRSSAMVLVYAAQQIGGRDPVAWQVAAALQGTALPADPAGADHLDRETGVAGVEGEEGVGHLAQVEAVEHEVKLGLGVALGVSSPDTQGGPDRRDHPAHPAGKSRNEIF